MRDQPTGRTRGHPVFLAGLLLILLQALPDPSSAQEGGVRGRLIFDTLDSPPFPRVAVVVSDGNEHVAGAFSDAATGSFEVRGVDPGTYAVTFFASCYLSPVLNDVAVETAVVDVGDVNMFSGPGMFESVQVVGSFNGWQIEGAPHLAREGCTWTGTVSLEPGDHAFKFVTDGNFDPSYGDPSGLLREIPGGPFTVEPVVGICCEIRISVPIEGDYLFMLDEARTAFTVEFSGVLPQGSVEGAVAFAGIDAPPFPTAEVKLRDAVTSSVVRTTTSDPATGAFAIDNVSSGTYDLEVAAPCYETAKSEDIGVGEIPVDVGKLTLAAGESEHASIALAGDFNGWNLDAAPMAQDPDCVWVAEAEIAPGTYNLKFVTGGAFDTPPDYGGNQGTTLDAPGTYPVAVVSGFGGAISLRVTAADTYRFELDERLLRFTVEPAVPVERVTWGAIKSRY